MTINSVAQEISDTGYGSPGLRDEVYIQLCKQVSDNPRRESLRRGWELLGEGRVRYIEPNVYTFVAFIGDFSIINQAKEYLSYCKEIIPFDSFKQYTLFGATIVLKI